MKIQWNQNTRNLIKLVKIEQEYTISWKINVVYFNYGGDITTYNIGQLNC